MNTPPDHARSARFVPTLLLGFLLLFSYLLREPGVSFGLPVLVHPDEWVVVGPARRIASGVDFDPHTFLYPSLTMYAEGAALRLKSAASSLAGPDDMDDATVYTTGRTLTVLFAVATVLATWLAAAAIAGPTAGLVAAALTSVSELHVAYSLPITTDMPMALFVVLSCWMSVRIHARGGRLADYVGAGLFAGLATSTKYNGVFAVLPIAVAHLVTVPWSTRALFDRRLLAAAAASLAGFFVASPYTLVHPGPFLAYLRIQREAYSLDHPGADQAGASYGFYLDAMVQRYGAPALAVAAIGVATLATKRPRIALILVAFPLTLFAFMGAYPVRFDRNIVSLVSFASIAAGCAVAGAVEIARSERRPRAIVGRIATAAFVLALVANGGIQLQRSRDYVRTATLPNTRGIANTWIDANLAPGAKIAREFYTPPVDARRFEVTEVGYYGLILAGDLARYDYLVASSDDYARFVDQADRYPAQAAAYRAIFEGHDLVKTFRGDGETSSGPEIRVYRRRDAVTK